MMNEKPTLDPITQALEARLAAVPPRAAERRREELLYECGRAAGRRSALPIVRRWQAAAALLAVGLVAAGVIPPATRSSPKSATQIADRTDRAEPTTVQDEAKSASSLIASVATSPKTVASLTDAPSMP